MIDDGDRWNDTVAMIGACILATLNALDRAKLLRKDSPVKDLGYVLALLGKLVAKCVAVTGDIPYISAAKEVCWPHIIVAYAKNNGIHISGVHDIDKIFVEEYGDESKTKAWDPNPAADRWGWKSKVCEIDHLSFHLNHYLSYH